MWTNSNLGTAADIVAFIIGVVLLYYLLSSRRKHYHLPPGPKPLPIVGNLFDIPKDDACVRYASWSKEYGDVISLSVLGQVLVVLNSHEAIKKTALRHAAAFSGRPFIQSAHMMKWDENNLALIPYGKRWRDRRRVLDNHFRPAVLEKYHPVQVTKLNIALRQFVERPTEFISHIREYTAAVILAIVYGYDVENWDDQFVQLTEVVNTLGAQTILPGALIVNTLPILARLPPWMLGSHFVYLLKTCTKSFDDMVTLPFEWVKASMRDGNAKQSLVADSLQSIPDGDKEAEQAHAEAFGIAYGAASDTTVSSLSSFMMAMVMHLDVQAKAHAELDRVIGRDRLPEFYDRENLPYINAILLEVLRWRPATPQGVPHAAQEDAFFDEYFIPRGSIVIGNAWAILHDSKSYPYPEEFKPERHIGPDGKVIEDPVLEYLFGFGNRKCPGRHLADETLWLFLVSVLFMFNITHAKDENGNVIPVDGKFDTVSLICHPLPFACTVQPRNAHVLDTMEGGAR